MYIALILLFEKKNSKQYCTLISFLYALYENQISMCIFQWDKIMSKCTFVLSSTCYTSELLLLQDWTSISVCFALLSANGLHNDAWSEINSELAFLFLCSHFSKIYFWNIHTKTVTKFYKQNNKVRTLLQKGYDPVVISDRTQKPCTLVNVVSIFHWYFV